MGIASFRRHSNDSCDSDWKLPTNKILDALIENGDLWAIRVCARLVGGLHVAFALIRQVPIAPAFLSQDITG